MPKIDLEEFRLAIQRKITNYKEIAENHTENGDYLEAFKYQVKADELNTAYGVAFQLAQEQEQS